MSKLLLVFLGLCCFHSAGAQSNWKSKGPLYEDKYITVEIEYAMGNAPCGTAERPSQYRYKITKLKSHPEFYIQWRFDYFNCEHQLKTHVNSLWISKGIRSGYILPLDNQFSALRLVNNFNAVKKALSLPEVTAYNPISPNSLEPKIITGKLAIAKGERTTLTFLGGYLALNTSWKWYEGSCTGPLIGEGSSINVQPRQTTTYALRAEGEHPTPCILATVNVSDISLAATAINGKSQVCEGENNILLTAAGGDLAVGAKWVWYQDNCEGVSIGEGDSVYVSPLKSSTYYVRAEGPGGNTGCCAHKVNVVGKSEAADRIDGVESPGYGDAVTLAVQGGRLAADARWVWYSGPAGNQLELGTGSSFTVASAYMDQTYYVRAEGSCFTTEFVSKTIRVKNKKSPAVSPAGPQVAIARPTIFFINGGAVSNDPSHLRELKNYVATIGGGKNIGWFVRAKITDDQSKASYQSTGAQITNYNQAGYYQYNSQMVSKRAAYTGGIYLGGKYLAVYIGGGYGARELLYGIGQYSYDNNFSSQSAWVKNTAYSYAGAEIEGGLIIKAGFFNMMGGLSTIQGKYTDYNLGIGFNF
jgi:hypothetical protein